MGLYGDKTAPQLDKLPETGQCITNFDAIMSTVTRERTLCHSELQATFLNSMSMREQT